MITLTQIIIAIAALGALGVSIYNATRIAQVHVLINSRLSELLSLTRSASRAEGLKEGRDEASKVSRDDP